MRMRVVFAAAVVAAALGGIWLGGCADQGTARGQRLFMMAAQEANQVAAPRDRLMRQLNIAEWQINRGKAADGIKTLGYAADTLHAAKEGELDELGRISGWVSISQLSRAGRDTGFALQACDEAVETLTAIKSPGTRCEYVLGVAVEVKELRGQKAAGELLVRAGEWAGDIKETPTRRQALLAFANRLFDFEEYDEGLAVLHREGDAAWRSDTLAMLARASEEVYVRNGGGMAVWAAGARSADSAHMSALQPAAQINFGKSLDYESNYQNKAFQQGFMPARQGE